MASVRLVAPELVNRAVRQALSGLCILLSACGGGSAGNMQDLQNFIVEVSARPGGEIESLPEFESYEAFTYSAAGLRSPFDIPMEVAAPTLGKPPGLVEPDLERPREALEEYALGSLLMVGMLRRNNNYQALVLSQDGRVHRVRTGNYIGRNHGRVVSVVPDRLEIVEIVPSGDGGWVERPRTLTLEEQ